MGTEEQTLLKDSNGTRIVPAKGMQYTLLYHLPFPFSCLNRFNLASIFQITGAVPFFETCFSFYFLPLLRILDQTGPRWKGFTQYTE